VGDAIRKAIRVAGYEWRPYIFRRYFDTRMMEAEADGILIRDWRTFLMGHRGSIESTYTVNKGLPSDVVEKIREAYAKAPGEYLTTGKTEKKVDLRTELAKQLLLISGFKPDEVERMNVSKMADEEIQRKAREGLLGTIANNGAMQKVVQLAEVERYVTEGWEFVDAIPQNKAIVKIPS
jgi:hypothetical protein